MTNENVIIIKLILIKFLFLNFYFLLIFIFFYYNFNYYYNIYLVTCFNFEHTTCWKILDFTRHKWKSNKTRYRKWFLTNWNLKLKTRPYQRYVINEQPARYRYSHWRCFYQCIRLQLKKRDLNKIIYGLGNLYIISILKYFCCWVFKWNIETRTN